MYYMYIYKAHVIDYIYFMYMTFLNKMTDYTE